MVEETTEETQTPETEEEQTSENQEEEQTSEKSKEQQVKDILEEHKKVLPENYTAAVAQKEHFRAKAEKAETELEQLKVQQVPKEETLKKEYDSIKLMQTVSILKDFSSDEIQIIARNARGAGISLEEAAKLDDVKL